MAVAMFWTCKILTNLITTLRKPQDKDRKTHNGFQLFMRDGSQYAALGIPSIQIQ